MLQYHYNFISLKIFSFPLRLHFFKKHNLFCMDQYKAFAQLENLQPVLKILVYECLSMFISLFNFRFFRNCREIEPCQIPNMEFFTKVVTFLTKPLPTGQIYVPGIFAEHSFEIFPVYSGKKFNEILGNMSEIMFQEY